MEVEESYVVDSQGGASSKGRQYIVTLRFADPAQYPAEAKLSYEEVRDDQALLLYFCLWRPPFLTTLRHIVFVWSIPEGSVKTHRLLDGQRGSVLLQEMEWSMHFFMAK